MELVPLFPFEDSTLLISRDFEDVSLPLSLILGLNRVQNL